MEMKICTGMCVCMHECGEVIGFVYHVSSGRGAIKEKEWHA